LYNQDSHKMSNTVIMMQGIDYGKIFSLHIFSTFPIDFLSYGLDRTVSYSPPFEQFNLNILPSMI
jgi:hypothetical protein